MKKYMLLTVMLVAMTVSNAAWSQMSPGAPAAPGTPPAGMPGGHNGDGPKFQEHKAKMLQRMNEHLAEVQKRISCVEAATNHEALRACMPNRGKHEWREHEEHEEHQGH